MWRYFVLRSSRRFSHKDCFDRRGLTYVSSFRAFSTNSMPNSSSLAIKASLNSRSSLLRFSALEIFACSSSIYFLHEAMSRSWPSISFLFFCFVCSSSIALLVESVATSQAVASEPVFFSISPVSWGSSL